MFKRKLTGGDYFLIAANAIPIFGALFLGWRPQEVFLVYCLETIIVGLVQILKMAVVTLARPTHPWTNQDSISMKHGLFFMIFFMLHYGIFVAIQMGIFFGVSGIAGADKITLGNFFYTWPKLLTPQGVIMLVAFAISYAVKAIFEFILSGEYQRVNMMQLMFQPYARIFVQQVVVILGSMFLLLGAGTMFLIIFALVKIYFEFIVNYDLILKKAGKELTEGKMRDER